MKFGIKPALLASLVFTAGAFAQSEFFPISDTTVLVYREATTVQGQGLRSIDTIEVRFYDVQCNSSFCGYTKLTKKTGVHVSGNDTTAYSPLSGMVYERMPATFPFGPSADIRLLTIDGKDTEVFFFNGSQYDHNLFVPDERSSDFSRGCFIMALYAKGIGMISAQMSPTDGRISWSFTLITVNGRTIHSEGALREIDGLVRRYPPRNPALPHWLQFDLLGKRVRDGERGEFRIPFRR
jgi:hypothetical protein